MALSLAVAFCAGAASGCLGLAPDDDALVPAGWVIGDVTVFKLAAGRLSDGHNLKVNRSSSVAFGSDGSLYVDSRDTIHRIRDDVTEAVVSDAGTFIALDGRDRIYYVRNRTLDAEVHRYDGNGRELLFDAATLGRETCSLSARMAVSPSGSVLAVPLSCGSVVPVPRLPGTIHVLHSNSSREIEGDAVAFLSDERMHVGSAGRLREEDVSGSSSRTIGEFDGWISFIDAHPEVTFVAVVDEGADSTTLWRLDDGGVKRIARFEDYGFVSFDVSPDGTQAAFAFVSRR